MGGVAGRRGLKLLTEGLERGQTGGESVSE